MARRGVWIALCVVTITIVVGVKWSLHQLDIFFNRENNLNKELVFYVPKGATLQQIINNLEKNGVITSPLTFRIGAMIMGRSGKLRAGEYLISSHATPSEIVDQLTPGSGLYRRKFVVPEGETAYEIIRGLNEAPHMTGEVTNIPDEGVLFPSTYFYHRGDDRKVLLSLMQREMKESVDELWLQKAPDLPIKTKEEALTLASIVEKESIGGEDMRKVASVFINRLKKGMPLQADPTVIYGMTLGKKDLDRRLTKADTKKHTPHNTYTNKGLPPTPIASPGLAALKSVLNPIKTDFLYFVADGTGEHVFAKTYNEHLRNVVKWRKIRKKIDSSNGNI